jgi:predicted PurR-regulated permease PerM
MQTSLLERYVWPSAVVLLAMACALVLRPFFSAILWSVILALTTWPLYMRLRERLRGRRNLAAGSMTLLIAVALVAPIGLAAAAMAINAEPVIEIVRGWLDRGLPDPPEWLRTVPAVGAGLHERWQAVAHDRAALGSLLRPLLGPLREAALVAGRALAEGLITLVVSTLICFFLYRDGEVVAVRCRRLVERFAGQAALPLVGVAEATIRGVVYGIIGTALAQGFLQTVGLWVAGVPGALLLGAMTVVLSLIPVGPPLVWGGSALWLYFQGEPAWAAFVFLWGVLVVSTVDNVIKPLLISHGAQLPFILVLLGVGGGVLAFGFIGVFIGPTLLAGAYRVLSEWSQMRREADASVPDDPAFTRKDSDSF